MNGIIKTLTNKKMKTTILTTVTWKVLPSNDTFTENRLVEVNHLESLREDTILELATEATLNYFKSNHPNCEVSKITCSPTIVMSVPSNEKSISIKTGIELITEERKRQIEVEGFTTQYDSKYAKDELAKAALCYVTPSEIRKLDNSGDGTPENWPWKCCWKPSPKNRVRELVKAGALIAAEIDRLNNI